MKSKSIVTIALISLFVLTAGARPLFGQGKSGQAPGQVKKDEKSSQAVLGNVEKVIGNAVVFEEKGSKKTVEVTTDSQTQVIGQAKKKLRLSDIKPKDMVAVVATPSGTATESGKPGKAIKVFVKEASPSAQGKRHAVHGIITGINSGVITLVHQIQQDRFYSVAFDSATVVKMKGIPDATTANLELGARIAAVGVPGADGTLLAKRIHVIPGKAIGVFKRQSPIATPSATIAVSPTPTATVSATLTPTPTATASATPSATPTVAP